MPNQRQADVRNGVIDALVGLFSYYLLMVQILIVSIGVGLYQESWWVFGEALLGLILLSALPYIRVFVCIALAATIGALAYYLVEMVDESAGFVAGGILFLVVLGINLSGVGKA